MDAERFLMARAVTRNQDNDEAFFCKTFESDYLLAGFSTLTSLIPIGAGWLSQDIAKWIRDFPYGVEAQQPKFIDLV
jgi:hypothetical protein